MFNGLPDPSPLPLLVVPSDPLVIRAEDGRVIFAIRTDGSVECSEADVQPAVKMFVDAVQTQLRSLTSEQLCSDREQDVVMRDSAIAASLYDLDYTARLDEHPEDRPEYLHRAQSFRSWLLLRGFDVFVDTSAYIPSYARPGSLSMGCTNPNQRLEVIDALPRKMK